MSDCYICGETILAGYSYVKDVDGNSRAVHVACAEEKCIYPVDDPVNHPSHYTSSPARCAKCNAPIECIDVTRHMGFDLGNAVKYIWRADLKENALQDLKKALWYLQDEIMKRERGVK